MDKRFVDEIFPVKGVGIESAREKSIHHGHISALHIWWARRPLASSRATIYAALVPYDAAKVEETKKFITALCKWENSNNLDLVQCARKTILEANGGNPPKVLDPFGGGGSIPLEALRLGCETYSNDYNPVATLIQKCILEYPQKFRPEKGEWEDTPKNQLVEDIKKWGKWVLSEAQKELARFYPSDRDGSIAVGYIWARTIPCQNPTCGASIPLMRQYWLARKENKKVTLFPYVKDKEVEFKIVGTGYDKMPADFDPDKGTVKKATATCQVCGSVVDNKTVPKLFREGKGGERMVAVVTYKEGEVGKKYRISTEEDTKVFQEARLALEKKRKLLKEEWGMDPVPDEPTPEGKGRGAERAFSIRNYNMNTWGDLFNARQKLALIVFASRARNAYSEMVRNGNNEEYAKVVTSYLAVILNKLADKNARLVGYHVPGEKIQHVFGRQILAMVWDYVELNPFTDTGWHDMQSWAEQAIEHCIRIPRTDATKSATISHVTATKLPYSDGFFDAIFTDPPYYDNVPYSYLSDFFYVWLKRTVGDLYPELFSTPLTPKSDEIVAYSNRGGGFEEGKKFFEDSLKRSFQEICRVLKPNGIFVIVYAHKSTAGWETLINSLLDSGLVVTAAWPIHTEMKARLRGLESAALASSIYIVCRKFPRQELGIYKNVKEELQNYLPPEMEKLWKEGISGPDFFIAAIGTAIEVFGKYEKVMDDAGNVIRADKLLDDVRRVVTDYTLKQVLHNGFSAEISDLTRFYVLWRWAFGETSVSFDEARKLAQSAGIDLSIEWGKGFITREKKQSNVLISVIGPQGRKPEDIKDSKEMIDVLHYALLLKGKKDDEMMKHLERTGYGKRDVFYRVAQAVSEILPADSKEKKMLEGFLTGKQKYLEDLSGGARQRKLFE
jgi:adenine-specific DNA methylase